MLNPRVIPLSVIYQIVIQKHPDISKYYLIVIAISISMFKIKYISFKMLLLGHLLRVETDPGTKFKGWHKIQSDWKLLASSLHDHVSNA